MSAMVRKIPLDEAQPGMVLGADVLMEAQLLLPCGTVLSAAQLGGLSRREVSEITVLAPNDPSAAELEERRAAQRLRVAQLFRRAGPEAIMQTLLQAVTEYRLERTE